MLILFYLIVICMKCFSLNWSVENIHAWDLRIFHQFIPHYALEELVLTDDLVDIRNVTCVLEIDQKSYHKHEEFNLSLSLLLNGVEVKSEIVTKFWQPHGLRRYMANRDGQYQFDRRYFAVEYNDDMHGQYLKIGHNGTIRENDVFTCKAEWDGGVLEKSWNATLFKINNSLATCRVLIDNHEDGTIVHYIVSPNYFFDMNISQPILWSLDDYGHRIFVNPIFVKPNADVYIECVAAEPDVDLLFSKSETSINETDFYENYGTFYKIRHKLSSDNSSEIILFFQKFAPNHVGHYSLRVLKRNKINSEISMFHFYFALSAKPKIVHNQFLQSNRVGKGSEVNISVSNEIPENFLPKIVDSVSDDNFLFKCKASGWQPMEMGWFVKRSVESPYKEVENDWKEKSGMSVESYLLIPYIFNSTFDYLVKCVVSNEHGKSSRTVEILYKEAHIQIMESNDEMDDISLDYDETWRSITCKNNFIGYESSNLDE